MRGNLQQERICVKSNLALCVSASEELCNHPSSTSKYMAHKGRVNTFQLDMRSTIKAEPCKRYIFYLFLVGFQKGIEYNKVNQ